MEKMLLQKKGYLIKISSWENDSDHHRTVEITVDTEIEALRIAEFCRLFRSVSTHTPPCIGNIYFPDHREWAVINETIHKFSEQYPDFFKETFENTTEQYMEFAATLGLTGDEFYTRVCDRVEILYIEADVYGMRIYSDRPKELLHSEIKASK